MILCIYINIKGKKMKKIILVLAVLLTTQLMAQQTEIVVKGIITNETSVMVESPGLHTNTDNCSHQYATGTLILPLVDGTKSLYAALLAATVSRMNVRFLYEGCLSGIPLINRIDLLPAS
jgi:hypothetical protein